MCGDLPPGNLREPALVRAVRGPYSFLLLTGFALLALLPPAVAQTPVAPPGRPALAPAPLVGLAPDTGRLPAAKRYLPSAINEPLMSMTIQVVKEAPNQSIYRSRHFEFTTPVKLGAGSMKEICRTFESTYELVSKLPWGINPWPEDGRIFHAQLFASREDYLKSGAPAWSAGIYSLRQGVFRIPFEEVGLKSRGTDYYLGGVINNDTITHEVTHQMMHEYLRFMPVWLSEGLAEYTANLPYTSGRYNVAGALEGFKQMRRNAGKTRKRGLAVNPSMIPKWIGAERLWGFTNSIVNYRPIVSLEPDPPKSPSRSESSDIPPSTGGPDQDILDLPNRYFSGHALAFFFMHLDGDGQATRLKCYFDALHEERKLWVPFQAAMATYQTAVTQYAADWEAFKRQAGVIDLGNGTVRYPRGLMPPKAPEPPLGPGGIDANKICAKHLGLLLDGRTLAQLDEEVRTAFAKAEIPLR